MPGGLYQTTTVTSSAINHLKKRLVGYGITKEGPIIAAQSMAKKRKLIEMLQFSIKQSRPTWPVHYYSLPRYL
jgi:hypothetical protein